MSPHRVLRPLRQRLLDDWRLPLAMVTAAVLFVGVIAFRARQISSTDTKLCKVLVKIVADGDHSLDGISYYKAHRVELRQAHVRNAEVIRELDCDHLPTR